MLNEYKTPTNDRNNWGRGLRLTDVARLTGASKNSVLNWSDPKSKFFNPDFPKPAKVGPRVLTWSENEVLAFILSQREGGATC